MCIHELTQIEIDDMTRRGDPPNPQRLPVYYINCIIWFGGLLILAILTIITLELLDIDVFDRLTKNK